MTSITVSTTDLRQALIAVAPHADPDATFPQLHRVRLEVAGENLTVSATNRYTVGHAIVSIWDGDGELSFFDLSPTNIKEVLVLFKGKTDDEDGPGNSLLIEATAEHLTFTDVSGLFPGKSLKLPAYPVEENFPDVAKLIRSKLTAGPEGADRLVTSGHLLGLFMKAASAYGESLVIDPAGDSKAMLITCGESFVGMLAPSRLDVDIAAKINGWHFDWLQRLQGFDVHA